MQGYSHWRSRGANRAPSALSSPWTTTRAALDHSTVGVMPPLPIICCMRMPMLVWRRTEWPTYSLLPLLWGASIALVPRVCCASALYKRAQQTRPHNPQHPGCAWGATCRFFFVYKKPAEEKNRRMRRASADFRPSWCSFWESDPFHSSAWLKRTPTRVCCAWDGGAKAEPAKRGDRRPQKAFGDLASRLSCSIIS